MLYYGWATTSFARFKLLRQGAFIPHTILRPFFSMLIFTLFYQKHTHNKIFEQKRIQNEAKGREINT